MDGGIILDQVFKFSLPISGTLIYMCPLFSYLWKKVFVMLGSDKHMFDKKVVKRR